MDNLENKPLSFKAATDEQIAARALEENERIYRVLESGAAIPARYAQSQLRACLEHKDWAGVFEVFADLWAKPPGTLIVLCGKRGTGKTTMAIEAMRVMMRARWASYYTTLEVYLRHVRGRDVDWSLVQEHFEDPKLLVIDECAKVGESSWEQRQFFHIVNTRFNDNKHTILVCSVLPAELTDFLGASLADRVNEGGAVLHCNWESLRR